MTYFAAADYGFTESTVVIAVYDCVVGGPTWYLPSPEDLAVWASYAPAPPPPDYAKPDTRPASRHASARQASVICPINPLLGIQQVGKRRERRWKPLAVE